MELRLDVEEKSNSGGPEEGAVAYSGSSSTCRSLVETGSCSGEMLLQSNVCVLERESEWE